MTALELIEAVVDTGGDDATANAASTFEAFVGAFDSDEEAARLGVLLLAMLQGADAIELALGCFAIGARARTVLDAEIARKRTASKAETN